LNRVLGAVLRGDIAHDGLGQLEDLAAALPSRPNVPLDDPRSQSQEEYRAKMGLWRRQVLGIVNDHAFWLTVSIASLSRQPLNHHHHFVMTKLQRSELESLGNHQAQLCCGKADEIFAQFDHLLVASDTWGPDKLAKPQSLAPSGCVSSWGLLPTMQQDTYAGLYGRPGRRSA
jgi:hypothetical protein